MRTACILLLAGAALTSPGLPSADGQDASHETSLPNVVLILADDLGYGDVSCQGQKLVSTPHIDRLAAEGMRFTHHYAGSAVCGPSRCALMTGKHTGHCSIRDNVGVGPGGGEMRPALTSEDVTVAEMFRRAGYATAAIGKWGLGDEGTPGVPWEQGFDHFFGYLHNTHGTRYYTEFIYRNADKVALPGNYGRWRKQYGPDLCLNEALAFMDQHRTRPFFLYYPLNLVHGDYVDPPTDSEVQPVVPTPGVTLTNQERTYLAMIKRLDRDVGRLIAQIEALSLTTNTLVIFTSDNGARNFGGANAARINSAGGLRGGKSELYEGGIRIPFIARWPGTVAAGAVVDHRSAFWDFLPTVCGLIGHPVPSDVDGISFLPTLLGRPQGSHDFLYWELAKRDEPWVVPKQALARSPWKLVRNGDDAPELYNLEADPSETTNVADLKPVLVAELLALMKGAHVDDTCFPLQAGPGYE